MPLRRLAPDLALVALLLVAPLLMFHQQTLGDRTLLPAENLYQDAPFATYREVARAPAVPHNDLLSDLVLQNYQWKRFIRAQMAQGEVPLWNPHLFAGIPFFAAGQHSALYPLSVIYYILPLSAAYGWFIVANLWLAGLFMAGYLRALGVNRAGAGLAGLVYQLCGFMIAGAVFPMIVAAAVWLPLILWMIENILRGRGLWIFQGTALLWVVIGALAVGCNILAGHIEMTVYTLLIAGYYASFRLLWLGVSRWRAEGVLPLRWALSSTLWLLALVALGVGLAALQLLPLYEFVSDNWRAERASLETVLGYAHPPRDVLQFLLPNIYGNPAHRSIVDVFSGEQITALTDAAGQPIERIYWGVKNYVEGALYLGILPLLLAAYALVSGFWRRHALAPTLLCFGLLALLALAFMFGAPIYGVFFALPGMNQLNTPFRWVYALTAALAVMAGIGLHLLTEAGRARAGRDRLATALGLGALGAGVLAAAACTLAFHEFDRLSPVFDRLVAELAYAAGAFADGRMFFSYVLPQTLGLALLLSLSGLAFLWAARRRWAVVALLLVAVDLLLASYGFNPASDPALLEFTPPAVQHLQGQAGHFRITSLQRPGDRPILNPNLAMQFGLDDIRGYDSIIPAGYVATMRALQPQHQLDFNRIAPLSSAPELNYVGFDRVLQSDLLRLLNLRYVLTAHDFEMSVPGWKEVYRDAAVAIWENERVLPRAFTIDKADWNPIWLAETGGGFNFGDFGISGDGLRVERYQPAIITRDSGREKFIDISLERPSWLVVSESYAPGWRAFARPADAGEDAEFGLAVRLVLANFQGVELPPGDWTLRLIYSPESVSVGMFASSISVALIVFLLGAWFWRAYIGLNSDESSGLARVARNSIAPIILNLFNRGIDFIFAIVMYRLLLPADVGMYSVAVVLFVACDIFTNFGLDLFLIREASQQRARAGRTLYNTSVFRLALCLAGVPLLAGVMLLWGASGAEAISGEGLAVVGLLYIGLFPASLSKGLTSLFYANEQAEKPAAIATITSMNKAVFGVIVLLLNYGIVGLAAVSIFNNVLTLLVLLWAGRKLIGRIGGWRPERALLREMIGESFPLMLNHLLATIFFQVDILLLQAIRGAEMVAQYSTGYKWLLAINIVPAFFTQALFPVLSRQAVEDRAAFSRSLRFGLKLLFALSLPLAAALATLAEPLTLILGGARYLPLGADALRLMIWSIPIGWMNSLLQYALVGLGLQRLITRAFAVAVVFNIVANALFIPQYGIQAAALTTIASELVLFLPFIVLAQRRLRDVSLLRLIWRPLAALAAMLAGLALLGGGLPGLLISVAVYAVVLLLLKPLDAAEGAALLRLLPEGARGQALARWVSGASL